MLFTLCFPKSNQENGRDFIFIIIINRFLVFNVCIFRRNQHLSKVFSAMWRCYKIESKNQKTQVSGKIFANSCSFGATMDIYKCESVVVGKSKAINVVVSGNNGIWCLLMDWLFKMNDWMVLDQQFSCMCCHFSIISEFFGRYTKLREIVNYNLFAWIRYRVWMWTSFFFGNHVFCCCVWTIHWWKMHEKNGRMRTRTES